MNACQHESFSANVAVNRMEDTGAVIADITIKCATCGEPFRFLGLPAGINWDHPTVSTDETELHVPIEPEGEPRLQTSASFQMPERLRRN